MVLFALSALSGCQAAQPQRKSLVERGLEMTAAMAELAGSEMYRAAITSADGPRSVIATMAAGDYSAPKAVYAVSMSEDVLRSLLGIEGELSETLSAYLVGKAYTAISNIITSHRGAETIAASASVIYSESFVFEGLEKPTLYLYQYEGDYFVTVSFLPGEDGAVSAQAAFVPSDDALKAVSSAAEVQAWLMQQASWAMEAGDFKIEVTQVQ